jgi:hypothetical protein
MSIKKYIDENRNKLDQAEVPSELWESISPEIKAPPKKRFPWYWAAAILVLGLSIPLVWKMQIKEKALPQQRQLLPSSFLSLEKNYSQELDSLQNRIPLAEIKNDPDLNWIINELTALEKINEKYRNDIGKGVPEEELVKVLIDYYEKRLHLLIRIERELKRKEKHHPHENINL